MLTIYLYREGDRTVRILTEREEVWMGTDADADIPLEGKDITARHCRLVVQAAGILLVREAGTVKVNGKELARSTSLYPTDKVFVGPYSFMIEALDRAPDATEEQLLADIAAGDDASRHVYADWLETNGDLRRAEFLRTQEAMQASDDRARFGALVHRLRQLALLIDIDWRMRVARAPIEGCSIDVRFDFTCPKQWSELVETENPEVRNCDLCRQQVFYCTSLAEARHHAWRGHCVAVDVANERTPRDLERTSPTVGMIAAR